MYNKTFVEYEADREKNQVNTKKSYANIWQSKPLIPADSEHVFFFLSEIIVRKIGEIKFEKKIH